MNKICVKFRRLSVATEDGIATQWVWELPDAKDLLCPFRERAIREAIHENVGDELLDQADDANGQR